MSLQNEIKYVIHKRLVYVIKLGPVYLWSTASALKNECIYKAVNHFKVKSKEFLKYKGAEIIQLYVKEIVQDKISGNI
jgi:competence transcription factor ComK